MKISVWLINIYLPFVAIAVDDTFSVAARENNVGYIGQVNTLENVPFLVLRPLVSVIVECNIAIDLPGDATHSIAHNATYKKSIQLNKIEIVKQMNKITSKIKVSICRNEKRISRFKNVHCGVKKISIVKSSCVGIVVRHTTDLLEIPDFT